MKLHTQIVMNVHGDTRHTFNPEMELEVCEAMKRFDELLNTSLRRHRLIGATLRA